MTSQLGVVRKIDLGRSRRIFLGVPISIGPPLEVALENIRKRHEIPLRSRVREAKVRPRTSPPTARTRPP